jgi:formylglycine-generating enzyme required for sulfatase activity
VDRVEVSVDAYRGCVSEATLCTAPAQGNYFVAGRELHPVNFVTADDAASFCAVVGKRLPTQTEWHWIAQQGTNASPYPWGVEEPLAADAVPRVCGLGAPSTCETGAHTAGQSSAGILDLSGNVAELVVAAAGHCVAGGAYVSLAPELRGDTCVAYTAPAETIGFRCVVDR